MTIRSFVLLSVLAMLAWIKPVRAAESYDNCTGYITTLPAVISTQGTWCLKQDLTTAITTGSAITIATNNVTLDCNDFKIGGLAAGLGTQTKGIYALNRQNAAIRHCNIRGFYYGLFLEGSSGGGHAVVDNRFDGNTFTGLQVEGDGSVVQRNRVFDTGGSTVTTYAVGINTVYSVDVLDNTVSNVTATLNSFNYAYGIFTFQNPNGRIVDNGVRGVLGDSEGFGGLSFGIYNENSGRVTMHNNDLVGSGTTASTGLRCLNSDGSAKDNVISAFATAMVLCSNAGGNYIQP